MLKTLICSALDSQRIPGQFRDDYFKERAQKLAQYAQEIAQALSEPLILDDNARVPDLEAAIWHMARNFETLICKDGKNVVGIAIFSGVQPRRNANFMGWIAPEYRTGTLSNSRKIRDFWREDVLDYAFNTLGLPKFETRCVGANERAINFALRSGFAFVGIARLDFQIQGVLCDSVVFEYLNPALAIRASEERSNGRQSERTAPESIPYDDGDERPEPVELPVRSRSYDELADVYAEQRKPAERSRASESSGCGITAFFANECIQPAF